MGKSAGEDRSLKDAKIAIFLPLLAGGGAEHVILILAEAFADQNIHVDLVLADAAGPLLKKVPKNVHLVDLQSSGVSSALPHLIRYLRRERPDALLSTLDHANVIAILARMLSGTKTHTVVRVATTLSIAAGAATSRIDRWMPTFTRLTYRYAGQVVAVSHAVAADIIQITHLRPGKVRTIYNPLAIETIRLRAAETVNHSFLDTDIPLILAVGRLTKAKDYPTLIRAFSRIVTEHDSRLLILGEGPERQKLETLIMERNLQSKVSMPGFIDNPYPFFAQASVTVLSSQWEGLPNVLLEALACGCPVVSTNCTSGPAEILENGKWGKLVPVGDDSALAKALTETIFNPPPADQYEQRVQDFAIDRIVNQYLTVLLGET